MPSLSYFVHFRDVFLSLCCDVVYTAHCFDSLFAYIWFPSSIKLPVVFRRYYKSKMISVSYSNVKLHIRYALNIPYFFRLLLSIPISCRQAFCALYDLFFVIATKLLKNYLDKLLFLCFRTIVHNVLSAFTIARARNNLLFILHC